MADARLELVRDAGDALGEGPVWDDRSGRLLRVDAIAGHVLLLDPVAGDERTYAVGSAVGCLALTETPHRLVLGLADGFGALDLRTGEVTVLATVPHASPGMQLNDGGCDPAGRVLAGSIRRDAAPGHGVLWAFAPGEAPRALLTGLGVSNGLAWDAAGTTLLHVDSLRRQVRAFDYDPGPGHLSGGRVALELGAYAGIPDGVALDAEGCLWVAFWRGGAVRRFGPDGDLRDELQVPVTRTTSCCLGGTDLRTLFVTTAARGLRTAGDPETLGGAVFAARVDVPGLPERRAAA